MSRAVQYSKDRQTKGHQQRHGQIDRVITYVHKQGTRTAANCNMIAALGNVGCVGDKVVYALRFWLLIVQLSQEVSTIASYSKFLLRLGQY